MTKLRWTLAALAALGGVAAADPSTSGSYGAPAAETIMVDGAEPSARGVAEDYLVLPEGGELTGQMKFITADAPLGGQPLKFTDLALFGLTGRWAALRHLEVSGSVSFLPKQPSYSSEHAWQSAGLTLRSPLGHHAAVALSGSGGHLVSSTGYWASEALMIEWKKTLDRDFLAFDIQGGVDSLGLADGSQTARLTEVALQTSALFREPTGHWGGWIGMAYAVPVQHEGMDPTTALPIDPQERLDFHLGTVLSLVRNWDLFADFAVIDRGDAMNPATRLPILDGGFDQKQIVLGVTRHIWPEHHDHVIAE